MSVDFKLSQLKFSDLGIEKNLLVVENFLTNSSAKALGDCLQLVLSRAVEKAPVSSGELRESSRAFIQFQGKYNYFMDVARGNADGSITKKDTKRLAKTGRAGRVTSHKITRMEGNIIFFKLNEWGEDVAVWAHEDLLPYTPRNLRKSRVPQMSIAEAREKGIELMSRTAGTGPKYLELAYLESQSEIINILNNIIKPSKLKGRVRRKK